MLSFRSPVSWAEAAWVISLVVEPILNWILIPEKVLPVAGNSDIIRQYFAGALA